MACQASLRDLIVLWLKTLITVFKESFPLARDYLKQSPQFLDATYIQLDNALMKEADLQHMRNFRFSLPLWYIEQRRRHHEEQHDFS